VPHAERLPPITTASLLIAPAFLYEISEKITNCLLHLMTVMYQSEVTSCNIQLRKMAMFFLLKD